MTLSQVETAPVVTAPIETPQAAPVEATRRHVEPEPEAITAVPAAERIIEPVLPPPTPAIQATSVALEPITLPPGLELIETNPDKLRIAASKVEPPQPPRPPRVRPPLPPISDEPLVLVETRK